MPSPERPGGEPHKEQEPSPYYRAARFSEEPTSRRTYFQLQETIFATDNELSAYRFQLEQIWHVAVVGDKPPQNLEQKIQTILAAGEPTSLPDAILVYLFARRAQLKQQGPRVERHHRSTLRRPKR